MVSLLHIETFATFDFDPSLILRLITGSDLKQIKRNSGQNWPMINLQNCKDEIAENFDPAPKNGKNLLYAFLFFCVGYITSLFANSFFWRTVCRLTSFYKCRNMY